MADGMMSRPPTGGGLRELTPRQQRRQQYLQARGRQFRPNQPVQAQPTEMPQQELTARQQRRQQYVANRDARRQRAVEDWRAQQAQQQMPTYQPGTPVNDLLLQLPKGLDPRVNIVTGEIQQDTPGLEVGWPIVPYSSDMIGGFTGQYPQQFTPMQMQSAMAPLPTGMTPQQVGSAIAGAPMQQPVRTPTPEYVNAMPGQLRTGTFTPQGMYRPLPYNATPQQIRERQALIETGGYFDQPLPSQRMR